MNEIRQGFNPFQAVAASTASFWCKVNEFIDFLRGEFSPRSPFVAGVVPLFPLSRVLLATVGQVPGRIGRGRLATVPRYSGRLDEFYRTRGLETRSRYETTQRRWLSAA